MRPAVSLARYLGERLRQRREVRLVVQDDGSVALGGRQDEVAAVARRWGFDWTRSIVSAIEQGRRQLTIEELCLLPWIAAYQGPEAVKRGDDTPVPLEDLIGEGGPVVLTARMTADPAALRLILSGRMRDFRFGPLFGDTPHGLRAGGDVWTEQSTGIAENVAAIDCLWPGAREKDRGEGGPIRDLLGAAHADKLADAEQKAARRLRTFPLMVAAAARKRWGRSFTEERDRRVAEQAPSGASPRTLQAARGHVARVLLKELREEGIEGVKPKRPARRRRKGGRRP